MNKPVNSTEKPPENREENPSHPTQVQTRAEKQRITLSEPQDATVASKQTHVKCSTLDNAQIEALLHTHGFVVLQEDTIIIDETTRYNIINQTRFVEIFNGLDEHDNVTSDGKRLQGTGEWNRKVLKLLNQFLSKKGLLRYRFVKDVYALRSLKGCQRQPIHTDVAEPKSLTGNTDYVPLALIYALEDNTELGVCPFTGGRVNTELGVYPFTGGRVIIKLKAGSMIIFRGDLYHFGMEYSSQNTRIHAYIDSPDFKRSRDKTYLRRQKRKVTSED